ncbi:MAG: hypothetical protein PHX77_05715 [Candidatus Bipolaricaulis sp.]|nr:hypothetical protein [Candidatus Bipolaricaulis sp.]MDD5645754.1 hypothetical protein [Candidatus Bipolaricaulis sp.]
MKPYTLFFDRGGYVACLAFLIGTGLALVLSMPWAGRVADFFLFPWRPAPTAFFLALAAFGTAHAVNRGAAVEPLPRIRRRQLLSLPLQVAFLQTLVLPYVTVCTILLPSRHAGHLWMAWGYVGLVSVAIAIVAFRLSSRAFRHGRSPFFPLLAFLCIYDFPPLLLELAPEPFRAAALVSPAAALWHMLAGGEPWTRLLFSFLVPFGLGVVVFLFAHRGVLREEHALRS